MSPEPAVKSPPITKADVERLLELGQMLRSVLTDEELDALRQHLARPEPQPAPQPIDK